MTRRPSRSRRTPLRWVLALLLTGVLVLSGCGAVEDLFTGDESAPTSSAPTSSGPTSPAPTSPGSGPEPTDPTSDPTSDPTPTAEPSPTREPEPTTADARVRPVTRTQWNRIVAAGMAYAGCPITGREQLRRVVVNHHTFDGRVRRGTLVVNADVARSVARIFTQLFDQEFPIRRMRPLEHYDGDSHASLRADNTASYNCRRPDQINAPQQASPHANGRAIDINPRENPWIDLRCQCWFPGPEFKERTPGPGKILEGGPVWQAFIDEGWIWQNIDVPDYMHFDTGYPSVAFRDPETGR